MLIDPQFFADLAVLCMLVFITAPVGWIVCGTWLAMWQHMDQATRRWWRNRQWQRTLRKRRAHGFRSGHDR